MIALAHPGSVALLLGQFEGGLEKVHEQPYRRVEPRERLSILRKAILAPRISILSDVFVEI